jgi:hypothetical protein
VTPPRPELERAAAERLASSEAADRDQRRAFVYAALGCVASCLVGMIILGFAFWVDDRQFGWIIMWAALIVGYGGMTYSLAYAYRKGEERGDW